MAFGNPAVNKGAPQAVVPQSTAAGSKEAVQLALEELRDMGHRFRSASKEQQVLIQATHVQWAATMTDAAPTPASYANVQAAGPSSPARQGLVQSSLEAHVSTLQIDLLRGFHELTSISHVWGPLKNQDSQLATSITPSTSSTFTPAVADSSPSTRASPPAASGALQNGIASFFSHGGELFHVFTEEQIADYQKIRLSGASDEESRSYATCVVSAVAAVGLQYMTEDGDISTEQSFYTIARHYYHVLLQFDPLEAIKVCALFVMYNVFAKSTVALAYVEVGLRLCHRFGIDKPAGSFRGGQEQWLEYRRAWRALVFFSGWLASTLGYVSGDDTLVRATPLSEIRLRDPSDLSEVAQVEMIKISLLKLRIIRAQEAFGEHSLLSVASTRSDLESWYSSLPQAMAIVNLSQAGLPVCARTMIYQVHLLYLGAIMLLYRRVASHIVRLSRGTQSLSLHQQQEELLKYIVEGRDAARHSATILSMVYGERAFPKRCWLVIFQAYTTCLVLLFSRVQSHVDDAPPDAHQADLEKARQCLEILEWCGSLDPVARQFHRTLVACYDALATAGMTTPTQENPRGAYPFYPGATLNNTAAAAASSSSSSQGFGSISKYFSIPPSGDLSFHRHAYRLLDLLCRPFSNPQTVPSAGATNEDDDDDDVSSSQQQQQQPWYDASGGDYFAQVPESMEWNPGSRKPFQWDLAKMGIPLVLPSPWPDESSGGGGGGGGGGGASLAHTAAESLSSSNHFVGSMQPSGWETMPSLMRPC